MKNVFPASFVLVTAIFLNLSAHAVDVTITSTSGDAFPVGATVTFVAMATNTNSVTTYLWDFDDNTPTVTTTIPMVDHVFTESNIYNVTVTVNNGVDAPGFDFNLFEAYDPPLPTDPLSINNGDPIDLNPDDGFSLTLNQAQAGFIDATLGLDAAHTGTDDEFQTDFGDDVGGRDGFRLFHRYINSGIFILDSVHNQSGSQTGHLRKTLAFSDSEIYGANKDPLVTDPALTQRKLNFKAVKGRFNFGANASPLKTKKALSLNDTVTVTWTMMLPAGFDVNSQIASLAIGNVMDDVALTKNGVGVITQPSPFRSVHFKFPRLKKGQTRAIGPVKSTVMVQLQSQDLPSQGFDTEGVTARAFFASASRGPFSRTIQVAAMFAGVAYSGQATVSFNIQASGDFGTISGRSAK